MLNDDGDGAIVESGAATTGSRVTSQRNPLSKPYTYGPRKAVTTLSAKQRLMVEYMVWGCPHASLARRVGHGARVPLDPLEAGAVLGMRRRAVFFLQEQPAFKAALAQAMRMFRQALQPEAFRTAVAIMREPGDGTAADRKVQLAASAMLLGDEAGVSKGSAVSVTINNNQTLQAGIVVRLPSSAKATPSEATIIEADG